MNAQEIKTTSAKWIELVKTTTTALMDERGGKYGKDDIIAGLNISIQMEEWEAIGKGDEQWLKDEIESQLLRGIELAKKWGYSLHVAAESPATSTLLDSRGQGGVVTRSEIRTHFETVTTLIKNVQSGDNLAWGEFLGMHAEFKSFQSWTEPTLSNVKEDWDLRIPADIREAYTTITRRLNYKASTPEAQAVSDVKLWAAVAHWAERYKALILVRNSREDVERREVRITIVALKELKSMYPNAQS